MNTINNNRKKQTINKIESAFINLLQTKEIQEITITDLVKVAEINRSTFYVNYLDIYDLADKIKEKMYLDIVALYEEERIKREHSYNYLKLFEHIKANMLYYKTFFKLNGDFKDYFGSRAYSIDDALKYLGTTDNLDYHIEYFKAGMKAIIIKWLNNDCKETPKEMVEILNSEYRIKK